MDDWLQWLKTIGSYIIDEEAGHVIVDTNNGKYSLDFLRLQEHYIRISVLNSNKPADSLFIKSYELFVGKVIIAFLVWFVRQIVNLETCNLILVVS